MIVERLEDGSGRNRLACHVFGSDVMSDGLFLAVFDPFCAG
jgi:hypothetical protein